MRQCLPGLITSEIFPLPEIDLIASGLALPFQAASLSAILMTNVFHHLPKPRSFLAEAARCLKPGGAIAMIEPWVTPWSGWVYSHLHEEPFDPHSGTWEFPEKGPLSGANNALAWIIFQRDREQFRREYPQMHIQQITPMMPFCYLLSGGVSLRSLMPGWSFAAWRGLENRLSPWMGKLAMFAGIVLRA
jgi:SAM-dependent methyltransferase